MIFVFGAKRDTVTWNSELSSLKMDDRLQIFNETRQENYNKNHRNVR